MISTYQAVSGSGKAGIDELGTRVSPSREDGGTRIAFNALTHAGSFAPGDDHTDWRSAS